MSAPMGMLHAMSHHGGRVPPVSAETRRRVWAFAHPYRSMVAGFVATVVLLERVGHKCHYVMCWCFDLCKIFR